jgi:Xaa-Pro aminopeptidase
VTGPGLAALPEGGRIDFGVIRADRRQRLRREMETAGLDALILGRPGDIMFAAGARTLFLTGSRPYSTGCVLLRDGERIHLLADYDEGVPAEIPRDHLFGRHWNPANNARYLSEIRGLCEATRIGTAGTSPGVMTLLASVAPKAEVIDARAVLRAARAPKSCAEVAVIATGCALAEAGLAAMRQELRPGVSTRHLAARYAERLGQLGVTVIPDGLIAHRAALGISAGVDDAALHFGDLVDLTPSVTYGGYDATLARTVVTGGSYCPAAESLRARALDALSAVVVTCVAGATGADLLHAWAGTGEPSFGAPLAHGLGIGLEEPVIGMGVGSGQVLCEGMVLAVQGYVHDGNGGTWHHRDVLQVTGAAPRLLTRAAPRCPALT